MRDDENPELIFMNARDAFFAALFDHEQARKILAAKFADLEIAASNWNTGCYSIEKGTMISYEIKPGGEVFRDTVVDVSKISQTVRTEFGDWVGFSQIKHVHAVNLRLVEDTA